MSKPTFREMVEDIYGENHAASIERTYAEKHPPKVTADDDVLRETGIATGWAPNTTVGVLAQAFADARNASWIKDAVFEWCQGPNQELVDFLIKRSK